MDFRILIVLLPLLAAAAWAVTRILPYALQQAKAFMAKS